MRKGHQVGHYSRTMPRVPGASLGAGFLLTGEVTLYRRTSLVIKRLSLAQGLCLGPCGGCGGADSGHRREAARLLPTVIAFEEKYAASQFDCQTLLDSTATTTILGTLGGGCFS